MKELLINNVKRSWLTFLISSVAVVIAGIANRYIDIVPGSSIDSVYLAIVILIYSGILCNVHNEMMVKDILTDYHEHMLLIPRSPSQMVSAHYLNFFAEMALGLIIIELVFKETQGNLLIYLFIIICIIQLIGNALYLHFIKLTKRTITAGLLTGLIIVLGLTGLIYIYNSRFTAVVSPYFDVLLTTGAFYLAVASYFFTCKLVGDHSSKNKRYRYVSIFLVLVITGVLIKACVSC